ncbi:uncharacterized protein LOC143984182 [Lithobates pipiens]
MASPHRALMWDIRKQIHLLNEEQLHSLAITLEDERDVDVPSVTGTNEMELVEFIKDYLRSDQLEKLEDQGMSYLLIIQDKINELKLNKESTPTVDIATAAKKISSGTARTEQVSEVVRLTDVVALLPRREFKMHGCVISDHGSDMSCSSVCRQIDEGLTEKFPESEIIRTVLRIIKPGNFKDMLTDKDDLTVAELKRFLKSHMRERSGNELFQDLSNAAQQERETAQQFVYRLVGLKQKVLSTSQHDRQEFNYDKKLVQVIFLHTLYQGLNEKNSNVRRDIKPYVSDLTVTDDFIIEQVTRSVDEETERQRRLNSAPKHKPLTVHSSQTPGNSEKDTLQKRVEGDVKANHTALMELTTQVSALTKNLEKMMKLTPIVGNQMTKSLTNVQVPDTTHCKPRCDDCIKRESQNCYHCFYCGWTGHRAVDCLKKRRQSGNDRWSLGKGQPVTTSNDLSHAKVNRVFTHRSTRTLPKENGFSKQHVAQLIGGKCLLSCRMNGVPVDMLMDTGALVSIVGKAWLEKFLPSVSIRHIQDLLCDDNLSITAANGSIIPFIGWIEVCLEFESSGHGNLAIYVPMLVSDCCNDNPILGFNVIEELIRENRDRPNSTQNLTILLSEAMKVRQSVANNIVNAVSQATDPGEIFDSRMVKVGKKGLQIKGGELCEVKCRIRAWPKGGIMSFEPLPEYPVEEGLELFPSVVDVPNGFSKLVKIPILNRAQHDIYLPPRTVLGTISPAAEILPLSPNKDDGKGIDQKKRVFHVNQLNQVDTGNQLPTNKSVKWHPPVNLEDLSEEEQEIARQMLYDESDVFARDEGDIGCKDFQAAWGFEMCCSSSFEEAQRNGNIEDCRFSDQPRKLDATEERNIMLTSR